MARPKGPFAGFAKNREPMLRVMSMHRDAAYAINRDSCPRDPVARGVRGLGRRGAARRAARLPQRAGDGARADRHHRSLDGLRHDGHRARLRAREVQEARRRRLLQDRQPVGARGARSASATRRPRCRRSSRTCRGTNTLLGRAARQPRDAASAKGFTDADLAQGRERAPRRRSSSTSRSARGCSARRRTSASACPRSSDAQAGLLAPQVPRLHARARSRRRTTSSSAA